MDLLDKVTFDIDAMRRSEGNLLPPDGRCKMLRPNFQKYVQIVSFEPYLMNFYDFHRWQLA